MHGRIHKIQGQSVVYPGLRRSIHVGYDHMATVFLVIADIANGLYPVVIVRPRTVHIDFHFQIVTFD